MPLVVESIPIKEGHLTPLRTSKKQPLVQESIPLTPSRVLDKCSSLNRYLLCRRQLLQAKHQAHRDKDSNHSQ